MKKTILFIIAALLTSCVKDTAPNITVNGVKGILLLPDSWSSATYQLSNINQTQASFSSNVISMSAFYEYLEANGVVFLPASGRREETEIIDSGNVEFYWSSSACGMNSVIAMWIDNDFFDYVSTRRSNGCLVRLVHDMVR